MSPVKVWPDHVERIVGNVQYDNDWGSSEHTLLTYTFDAGNHPVHWL